MFFPGRRAVFTALLAVTTLLRAAEEFGDISVSAAAMYTGNTFHGYGEMRVTLENHSHSKTHSVTLTFPNNAWNNGNSLGRLARTVKLEPEAREIVPLLQPPLPANGDSQIRVEVDGRREGLIMAPNANGHCNFNSRGEAATVFVSRSLDFDAVQSMINPEAVAGTVRGAASPAAQAAGAPGAFRSGRKDLSAAWMPNPRSGSGQWLEVDYVPTQTAEKITIHSIQAPLRTGSITLTADSGTNLLTALMSAGKNISDHGQGWNAEFTFPPTAAPVKTVRIDFGTMSPHVIAIDGVQISGPAGSQWAATARASSENTTPAGTTTYPPGYRPAGSGAETIETLRAESPVSEWSENWLAYTPFDAMVLNAADLAAMSPAIFAALGDYVHAGGNIVLLGKKDLPAAWQPARMKKLPGGAEYEIGFGSGFLFGADNPAGLGDQDRQRLRDAVRGSARYWQTLPADSGAANAAMPVVENLKIPTRGIVVIMLAFIIIIGPVNIYLLNRRQRRTWMLWTIPAISLVTTLIVFAYSLVREGITPDTRIAGLTVIDQASHHATTIGATAFYCPLTPSGGLRFDYETEATPLVSRGYGSGTSREVDWTQSQHLQHGWISARVPAHFHLRKSETRRERIQILNENGKLQIVNGLSAPIKSLWVADAEMNLYAATGVAAGQKAGLIPSPAQPAADKTGAGGLLRELTYAARTDPLAGGAGRFLTPNSYIAVLDGNPFIENALGPAASAKRTKSSAVVYGNLEAAEVK